MFITLFISGVVVVGGRVDFGVFDVAEGCFSYILSNRSDDNHSPS